MKGYKEHLCLACSTGAQVSTKELSFWLQSKCATTLSVKEKVLGQQMIVDHDSASFSKDISQGWSSFFENSDAVQCPYTACTLLEAGCALPYTRTNLQISDVYPFKIQVGARVTAGYVETVCVQCTNGYQQVVSDGF